MAKFVKDLKEFYSFCEKNEVEFVDFRFTSFDGAWNHLTYTLHSVTNELLENGIPFDASSYKGWQPIEKSDMILKPDITTAFLDPFTSDNTIIVICDIYDVYKNEFYEKCPRTIAKKAQEFLKQSGIADEIFIGAENEFFVFDDVKIIDSMHCAMYQIDSEEGEWNDARNYDDSYNSAHRPRRKGGYTAITPIDSMQDLRAEMVQVLQRVGLECFIHHHEVAQGQGEIGVKFDNLVQAADNVQIYKYVVKMVAHLNGKTATFMPKPLHLDNGSGMHVHMSLFKDGVNLFYDEKGYSKLSQTAIHFIGGVLRHAKSVAAFSNATTNSYKRLIPGFEAPSILTYSCQNRSASCRVPYGIGKNSARVEMRFPDSSSNVYLCFASLLLAGIDGVKNKLLAAGPMDENLFKLSLDEIREKGIEQMPHTLRSALENMLKDNAYLRPIFSEVCIQDYQRMKFKNQVWPIEQRPTAYEFKTTYSC
ncbi:type I glutamate--ammonia ligase [Campylobacter canadensis]|uniref:Glutamine synthetase n=1 Tax=Campylobacter canadensis TaxID=449520 RepID=A0ABS7WUT5_9BACT|nr:type I glutamate--ammonia ligase [Campylobacter canadensis]MBZ7988146.1 type I glutamate--ammonia ligase [Campylobacter canadensis]MBZ7999133.1 type I glutamate--ammonia ligase [Campylobacter canadensis]